MFGALGRFPLYSLFSLSIPGLLPLSMLTSPALSAIPTYQVDEYLQRFMPESLQVRQQLSLNAEPFLIMAVEQMYPYFAHGVSPVRATGHSCLFLTSGTARMCIGPELYTIQPGEVLLVRAGQVHSFEPGDVNTGFICRFTTDFLGSAPSASQGLVPFALLQVWGNPLVRLSAQTATFVEHNLKRLLVEYQAHQVQHPELVRAYLLALLHELSLPAPESGEPLSAALTLTNRFKQLVACSLRTVVRISDYAALLHVTPNHLTKSVRTVTGKSPIKWLEESRVLEAKVLLFQSELSISDIALQVGVADASYFSRFFKQHVGVTPQTYRGLLGTQP
jgi:AraC family transcriptional activator of pobA